MALPREEKERLYEVLRGVYAELEKQLDQEERPCTSCGACCRFSEAGHRLYVSSLEAAWVLEAHKPRGDLGQDVCPFLTSEHHCGVRERRMVGCRTYYRLHQRDLQLRSEDLCNEATGKIKSLCRERGWDFSYVDWMQCLRDHARSS